MRGHGSVGMRVILIKLGMDAVSSRVEYTLRSSG